MNLNHENVINIKNVPSLPSLLFKVGLKRSSVKDYSVTPILPNVQINLENIVIDKANYALFHNVVGWQSDHNIVHPCFLHALVFPLHLKLFLHSDFPFPIIGLVHIRNQIEQFRPVGKGESLSVTCCFDKVEIHPKGWLFSIGVNFYNETSLVWKSFSTYLFRTKHKSLSTSFKEILDEEFVSSYNTCWDLDANLGRRYARASGDFNPIHLTSWMAKMFGFKRHITHGMWTKSYSISALQKNDPTLFYQGVKVDAEFKKPLFLPNQATFSLQQSPLNNAFEGSLFAVRSTDIQDAKPNSRVTHLLGCISTI